jgi:hypothetical protein
VPERVEPAPEFRVTERPAAAAPHGRVHEPIGSVAAGPANGRSRRRSAVIVVLAVAAVLGAAVAAVVVTGLTSKGQSSPTLIHPLQASTTGVSPPGGPPAARLHRTKHAFIVGGVRFAVFADPNQAWTTFVRRVPPAQGSRWVLVTLVVRNLSRVGFDPRVLHYRLIAAGGPAYFPDLGRGTGPDVRRAPHPLAVGALTQAQLAFQVPNAAAGLQLAFDPTGRHERVVVALGQ